MPNVETPERTRTWYSTTQAAEYLGVHPVTVRRWIRMKRIKNAKRVGARDYRIHARDVERLLTKA